jgi:hypothetical protein
MTYSSSWESNILHSLRREDGLLVFSVQNFVEDGLRLLI